MDRAQRERLAEALHRLKRSQAWFVPKANISRGEFFMLHRIAHMERGEGESRPGARVSDLSAAAQMSRPAVSQMLNSLENKDLIRREMTRDDRRAVYVSLTETGRAQLDGMVRRFNALLDRIVEELGETDTAELIRILEKLYGVLEKQKRGAQ